jgi:hypothetical protein
VVLSDFSVIAYVIVLSFCCGAGALLLLVAVCLFFFFFFSVCGGWMLRLYAASLFFVFTASSRLVRVSVLIIFFRFKKNKTHVKKFKAVTLHWNLYILYLIYNFSINNYCFSIKICYF